MSKVRGFIPKVRRNPRPIFGFWLPFIGVRREYLWADEAWDIGELREGAYDLLMCEWLGRGVIWRIWLAGLE